MARRKKGSQKNPKGCKVCGDPDVGRGIQKHVAEGHRISYTAYLKCFQEGGKVIVARLVETGKIHKSGERVMVHVFVRKFIVPAN